ncbi:hypothetical protein BOTBODRAFT_31720 [Botryobasidium botryosum FD-172 SS1]|uniref:Uncharacterized protein n=1 Tax=Botryobasidium botryosum (strain FD-172 SS1) TaxID=930990 RepID=A0A067MI13_BOTB1|nr:hypothetical protein BOTBODRAFT_31720 [Botryobasidium botryosum FD-172 SS1]
MASQAHKNITPLNVPPIPPEEEEAIIHARATNDERPLRRLIKKYHTFTSLARASPLPPAAGEGMSKDDARQAFLVELSSFRLLMQKNVLMQDVEERQVKEYEQERERIENKHDETRQEVVNLKKGLEDAQIFRRRKIEYDVVAEKINTLPSRAELEESISSLETEIESIQEDQKATKLAMENRRTVFDTLVRELNMLRLMGRDNTPVPSRPLTPAFPDTAGPGTPLLLDDATSRDPTASATTSSTSPLNPAVRSFEPRLEITPPSKPGLGGLSSALGVDIRIKEEGEEGEEEGEEREGPPRDDVEMGEVPEEGESFLSVSGLIPRGKRPREELEEGEASDGSSDLTELPEE